MLKTIAVNLSLILATAFGGTLGDTSEITSLRNKTSFNIYVPSYSGSASSFEIKVPTDIKQTEVPYVMVNYFDANGSYVFGVSQLENNSFMTKEITEFDVKKNTKKTRSYKEKVILKPQGELVSINGNKGWYEAYVGNKATGGKLRWVISNTYIEPDTANLSKSSLVKVAESMKKVK